jgi:hypothetical protein
MEPLCFGKPGDPGQGHQAICRGCAVDRPNRQSLAGSAALVRPLEQCLHALPRLGEVGYLDVNRRGVPTPIDELSY